MSSKSLSIGSGDLDFALALQKFPLAPWLVRHGFTPQGRAKQEFLNDCPFCGAEDKLSVNPTKGHYRCFVCAKQFKLVDLIAAFEGSYAQALEVIRAASGGRTLALIPEEYRVEVVSRPAGWEPQPIFTPESFVPLHEHIAYTKRRGFDLNNMRRLGVGICSRGRYQDRLVFPVRRWNGQWIYFQSRATWEKSEHLEIHGKYRKNLNPANDDVARFASAGDVLLGLELIHPATRRIAIVEGPTDWLQVPGGRAVALFGKVLSDRQLSLLVRSGVREIDVALDPDAWIRPSAVDRSGRMVVLDRPAPAKVVADRLAQHFTVRIVRYPEGFDPGSFTVAENQVYFDRAELWGDGSRLARI